ncbi:MAG: exodeoxyribonuclease VII small subunit [Chloroherpetonaceae bacterium]|nr:exodeoxyribonuclease VII small subunit [Chloroherpetonaceae bacterium]
MPKKNADTAPIDFSQKKLEELIARLQVISEEIQNESTGIEDAILLYEEGQSIAKHCSERLNTIQKKLEVLNPALFAVDMKKTLDTSEDDE